MTDFTWELYMAVTYGTQKNLSFFFLWFNEEALALFIDIYLPITCIRLHTRYWWANLPASRGEALIKKQKQWKRKVKLDHKKESAFASGAPLLVKKKKKKTHKKQAKKKK